MYACVNIYIYIINYKFFATSQDIYPQFRTFCCIAGFRRFIPLVRICSSNINFGCTPSIYRLFHARVAWLKIVHFSGDCFQNVLSMPIERALPVPSYAFFNSKTIIIELCLPSLKWAIYINRKFSPSTKLHILVNLIIVWSLFCWFLTSSGAKCFSVTNLYTRIVITNLFKIYDSRSLYFCFVSPSLWNQ